MGRHEATVARDHPRPEVVPVDRRWLGLDRASIGPALLVLGLALVLGLGAGFVDAVVPRDNEVRPGDVVVLAGGVEVIPAPGWVIASGLRAGEAGQGSYPPSARLTDGAVTLDLQTAPWPGTAAELFDQVQATTSALAGDAGPSVQDGTQTLRTAGGDGVVARYRGPAGDGLLGAVVVAGTSGPVGVSITATGPADAPDSTVPTLVGMIQSIAPADGSPS